MALTTSDSDLQLEERRELTMQGQALLEALLEFDRVNNGWLWRATDHSLSINTEGSPPVVVEARRSDGDEVTRTEFSIGHIAATFIHMCRQLRIPMPRNSRKEVKITADGATLILYLSAPIPRRHSQAAAAATPAKPKAELPAVTEPDPAEAADAPPEAVDAEAAAAPAAEAAAETPAPAAAAG